MRVFSWVGFVLIIPVLVVGIRGGSLGSDAMKGLSERAYNDARTIESRLSAPARMAGVVNASDSPALTSIWRGLVPMVARPFTATRRSQRVAGE